MTPSLTAVLIGTPSTPPTYNPGMAETFSWVPMEGAGRPLFAQASWIANPDDFKISLSAGNINLSSLEINTDQIEPLIIQANTLLAELTAQGASSSTLTTNTLLSQLTAQGTSQATSTKQDDIITLLRQLTANTDTLEINTDSLEVNTDQIEAKQDTTNTLLSQLTALQSSLTTKQDNIITLLNAITGTALEVDLNTDQLELHVDGLEAKQDTTNSLLTQLTASLQSSIGVSPGFGIPVYDQLQMNYVSGTTDISQVTYFKSGTQVGQVQLNYSNTGLLTSVQKT